MPGDAQPPTTPSGLPDRVLVPQGVYKLVRRFDTEGEIGLEPRFAPAPCEPASDTAESEREWEEREHTHGGHARVGQPTELLALLPARISPSPGPASAPGL
jgi:hypothetical protein